jgi:hypothetical protein
VSWGGSQYADIPFACFVLIALVLICLHEFAPAQSGTLLVLAGLAAGFAAWTKNEGMLFLLAIVTAYAAVKKSSRTPFLRDAARLLGGVLPVVAIVLFFKSQVTLRNDILGAQTASTLAANTGDVMRYLTIAAALGKELVSFGNWLPNPIIIFVLYAVVLRFRVVKDDRAGVFITGVTLCVMLFGYLFIYLITPRDLVWHLSTSLDRLVLHLWPGIVFLFFLVVRSPSDFASGLTPVQPHNVSPDRHFFVV